VKTFLHIGCGIEKKDKTTKEFASSRWKELRFDIDAKVSPDLIGTMTDMSSVDAIFSSHNIEHLYPHEVPLALKEFSRVLKPDGFAVITCPDLQAVAKLIAEDKLLEPAYDSPAGPISPIDILYGHRPAMSKGNLYMAHRCGFTQRALTSTVQAFGFAQCASAKRGHPSFDLWIVATVREMGEEHLRNLAAQHFP
jgi:hypothetical protein